MCPTSVVRFAVWVKFGADGILRYLPIGRIGETKDGAIDWAARCLAGRRGPCWVGVYRYRWCDVRQQNLSMLVWEDSNESER